MIDLRWYVEEQRWSSWDDRFSEWTNHAFQKTPVLQYRVGDEWITVPTFIDVKGKYESD